MLLVFEIGGTIEDFFKAVVHTEGMEYLLEYQDDYLPNGSGFFYRDTDGHVSDRAVEKRVFVTITNERGIKELLSYWEDYKYGEEFNRGVTKFRNLFSQLTDIRPYNLDDRLKDTGFSEYLEDLRRFEQGNIKFEIEFAYHSELTDRNLIVQEVNDYLGRVDGRILTRSVTAIPEIKYFAAIAEAPISAFRDLSQNANVAFLQSGRVLFFKPVGQTVAKEIQRQGEDIDEITLSPTDTPSETMIAALLDGAPIENHQRIRGKIVVDDPDGFSTNYLAAKRFHGTAMASLIINGDFDNLSPINGKLYVRPILRLFHSNRQDFEEKLPDDQLSIDLIYRAFRRIYEGEDGQQPVAPGIKIVNFSIGDAFRPFVRTLSSWSKLLDFLANKYKVLIIISAGNYDEDIALPLTMSQFESLPELERQSVIYKTLFEKNFARKILTPAESVNGLTIGGLHSDRSTYTSSASRFDPNPGKSLPSPISRIGNGYNRAMKPDIIFDSGRALYRIVNSSSTGIILRVSNGFTNYAPGIKVAIPGDSGNITKVGFSVGTSNSTALVTNLGCKLYDVLEQINSTQSVEKRIPISHYAVLIKALLVHYSDFELLQENLRATLGSIDGVSDKILKEYVFQNTGYGILNSEKLGYCTDTRVTLVGFGSLKKEGAQIYKFPLPSSLSGRRFEKKLTITLAWLSPLNFNSGKYKMAQLYFDNIKSNQNDLFLERTGTDYYRSRRGTVQHDILSNDSADVYIDNSELSIKINCREAASGLHTRAIKHSVEYGLAVTLELSESNGIPIYDEIKSRVEQRVPLPR
jgi:hypothetical protein